ncbi:DUF2779 domain-containing protein [Acidovorax sp. ACV01]|uniref:DUF2779 domain-containing protein n=1 Tax=Acidovorax sp. ACV01 TaxID=2769311 RepID=UPI0017844D76|nr:DUF2779 domain-containing protein [Acidovorax sp. ACV01]
MFDHFLSVMNQSIRYLTKSRFKLAAECPRKLYYTGKKDYLDRSIEDSFLAALAEGGYQVGELACLVHPGGIRVDDLDHHVALAKTAELLQQDEVTIFEAAIAFGSMFVRVDVLRKMGTRIEIIEVKAKSYSAKKDGDFTGAKGQLKSEFLPYLQDVAFQRYVTQNARPDHQVHAFLMLVDKEQFSTVDGLNQRFKVVVEGRRLRVQVEPGTTLESLGQLLLAKVPVDVQVDMILSDTLMVGPTEQLPFPEAVGAFALAYAQDTPLPPVPSSACSGCQFKAPSWPLPEQPKSGFHECWSQAFNWGEADFSEATVLDLWNLRGKNQLIEQGVLKAKQVTLEDLKFDGEDPGVNGMTRQHRQWYVCQPEWPGGGEYYFDGAGYLSARAGWKFPLHCIDFETSAVAIPFASGRHPYELTAFQFSHHVVYEDGRVEHRSQWLCAKPGVDPNIDFVRALCIALDKDNGTIFRWSAHENTVLNKLREELLASATPPQDKDALVSFIESITSRSVSPKEKFHGPRTMVDLCEIAEKFYFHPSTNGSNSLKKVLPALMKSSTALREIYGKANYGGMGVSLNFVEPIAWWQERDGEVMDPYALLPPVFDDVSRDEADAADEGLSEELKEGGAAMAAYARLQFEDLPDARRANLESALLRYCELDTLAMVMAIQAWDHMAAATAKS